MPVKMPGSSPGVLIYTGEVREGPTHLTMVSYNKTELFSNPDVALDTCERLPPGSISWLMVEGSHDPAVVEKLGNCYGLDPLILEDMLNPGHRPKAEIHQDGLFVIAKWLKLEDEDRLVEEQIALILKANMVVLVREHKGPEFQPILQRIENTGGRLRKKGADYLFYAILDLIVDQTMLVLAQVAEKVESLEEDLLDYFSADEVLAIKGFQRTLIRLRRVVHAMREAVLRLQSKDAALFEKSTQPYLRDLLDHAVQAVDQAEMLRDLLSNMNEYYLSEIGQRTNETMKFLTIMGTIFIPLTFLAGIYGMNFQYMPELHWAYGYPVLLGAMVVVALLLLWFFRRKKWL